MYTTARFSSYHVDCLRNQRLACATYIISFKEQTQIPSLGSFKKVSANGVAPLRGTSRDRS